MSWSGWSRSTPFAVILLLFAAGSPVASSAAEPAIQFGRDILPILSDKCFRCHGPDEKHREAGLRLDDEQAAKADRDGTPAIVPGKAQESEILRRITSTDPDLVMPPPSAQNKISPAETERLTRWIEQGAKWGGHWAYDRIGRPPVPTGHANPGAIRNPIDAFLLLRLEREGLSFAPEASRETLIRRLSLDLRGLPPAPDEVAEFVGDAQPGAYERLIERFLASPHYGERMAWDWLDAARYADSNGYQGDGERTMWPWRDWVVQSFNANQPYDQFTTWQLAGDLLPQATDEQILATGFCRNHMINGEGGRIAEENRIEYVFDQAETLGTVWLGLTFNCCRCHDHKFDPISQRDYYSLFAFFNQTPVDGGGGNPQQPPNIDVPSDEQREKLAAARRTVEEFTKTVTEAEQTLFPTEGENKTPADSKVAEGAPDEIKGILRKPAGERNSGELDKLAAHFRPTQADYATRIGTLKEYIDRRNAASSAIPRVMVMKDLPGPRKTFRLEKGLYNQPLDEVSSAVPAKLPPLPEGVKPNRLGLAQWLVTPENPLTARVTVNRLWQQFFGIGLVKTPDDFGLQGERPIHPELIDWLAAEFQASGWDTKHLVRLMLTSAAYRQSSRVPAGLAERDPENRLLARGPRYRMPFWMIRDQALAASGLLVEAVGGAPVNPYQPEGVWEEATFGNKRYAQDHGDKLYRRSLYTFWRRIVAPTMFFDNPSRQTCTVKVARTNTPLQSLFTLNDIQFVEASRVLADQAVERSAEPAERVRWLYGRILGRFPSEAETRILSESAARIRAHFVAHPSDVEPLLQVGERPRRESLDGIDVATWTAIASEILNLDEAVTRE